MRHTGAQNKTQCQAFVQYIYVQQIRNRYLLSVVMMCTTSLNGSNSLTNSRASVLAFLPCSSFSAIKNPVFRSTIVNIAPLFSLPTMVSTSQSPRRAFLSTISGRSSMLILSLIIVDSLLIGRSDVLTYDANVYKAFLQRLCLPEYTDNLSSINNY